MARRRKKAELQMRIDGLIEPYEGSKLRAVWKAFQVGGTWHRLGKSSRKVARFRHKKYVGKVRLEWWGKAIRFTVEDADNSGRIAGAFVGHVQRHGKTIVDRIDLRFEH